MVEECLRWCTVDWLSVLVADTDEQAEAAAAEAKADRLAERERYFRKYQDGVLGRVASDVLTSAAFRSGADMLHIIAGSPDTVAADVQRLADLGINHLIVRFLGEWLGQTRGLLERSLQLFADEVAPRFSEIPSLTDRSPSKRAPCRSDRVEFATGWGQGGRVNQPIGRLTFIGEDVTVPMTESVAEASPGGERSEGWP